MEENYNHLNTYLKKKFGQRVLKVCIDGGFTCPNRDGSKGYGGCIFCGSDGAGENIKGKQSDVISSIKNQVETFLSSYRGERADKFIAYFQSFSGTYDSMENLRLKYDTALNSSDKFIGLDIATRPDLINADIVELLREYKQKYYVCVELGLQTANDETGQLINRQYSKDDFIRACEILNDAGIDIIAHIMVGLPNETTEDIIDTVDLINECKCSGVKIHSTYILRDTKLYEMYLSGEYEPITRDYYVDMVALIISRLDRDIIVHRITADPPKDLLIAPNWTTHKKLVLNAIERKLKQEDIYQGKLFKGDMK